MHKQRRTAFQPLVLDQDLRVAGQGSLIGRTDCTMPLAYLYEYGSQD